MLGSFYLPSPLNTKQTVNNEPTRAGKNVYVIEHEHGYIKIGVSNNPKERVDQLQTASPYELRVLGEIHTNEPFTVESHLHEKYSHRKKRGEWYQLTTGERGRLLVLCDMEGQAIDRRYTRQADERRELILTMQGLVG